MARVVKGHPLTITPVRTLNAPFDLQDFPRWGDRQAARLANPYKVGDVVWSKAGRRALVITLHIDRPLEGDLSSPLLPVLQVREETAAGTWSKQWVRMWPGDIDRAFEAA